MEQEMETEREGEGREREHEVEVSREERERRSHSNRETESVVEKRRLKAAQGAAFNASIDEEFEKEVEEEGMERERETEKEAEMEHEELEHKKEVEGERMRISVEEEQVEAEEEFLENEVESEGSTRMREEEVESKRRRSRTIDEEFDRKFAEGSRKRSSSQRIDKRLTYMEFVLLMVKHPELRSMSKEEFDAQVQLVPEFKGVSFADYEELERRATASNWQIEEVVEPRRRSQESPTSSPDASHSSLLLSPGPGFDPPKPDSPDLSHDHKTERPKERKEREHEKDRSHKDRDRHRHSRSREKHGDKERRSDSDKDKERDRDSKGKEFEGTFSFLLEAHLFITYYRSTSTRQPRKGRCAIQVRAKQDHKEHQEFAKEVSQILHDASDPSYYSRPFDPRDLPTCFGAHPEFPSKP